jgi:hypothetical protein
VIETEMGSGLVKICSRDEAKIEHAKAEILSLIEKNQVPKHSLLTNPPAVLQLMI